MYSLRNNLYSIYKYIIKSKHYSSIGLATLNILCYVYLCNIIYHYNYTYYMFDMNNITFNPAVLHTTIHIIYLIKNIKYI